MPRQNKRKSITFIDKLKALIGRDKNTETFQTMLEETDRADTPLTKQEQELIGSVLNFGELEAEDVAIPRSEIVYLHTTDDYTSTMKIFEETRHSRLPVCGQNIDVILGFITLKDVILYNRNPQEFNLKKLIRSCPFIPGTMSLDQVLQRLRTGNVQMAIVVDEYGATEGLLTLKDILKQLVGSIQDEHEEPQDTLITELGVGRYLIDPRLKLHELNSKLKVRTPNPDSLDFDTIGGLALHLAGKVPEVGDEFTLNNKCKLIVRKADQRRVQQLELVLNHTSKTS